MKLGGLTGSGVVDDNATLIVDYLLNELACSPVVCCSVRVPGHILIFIGSGLGRPLHLIVAELVRRLLGPQISVSHFQTIN